MRELNRAVDGWECYQERAGKASKATSAAGMRPEVVGVATPPQGGNAVGDA